MTRLAMSLSDGCSSFISSSALFLLASSFRRSTLCFSSSSAHTRDRLLTAEESARIAVLLDDSDKLSLACITSSEYSCHLCERIVASLASSSGGINWKLVQLGEPSGLVREL